MKSAEIYQEVTDKIVAALKDGVIPWEREFTVEGGVHRSFSTHKAYRGGNQFYLDLIAHAQDYKSPFWITLNQIKKRGGNLKKINRADEKGTGQKSSIIFYFKMFQPKDKHGRPEVDEKGKPVMLPFLKSDRVFNLDQTEGIEAPELEASKYTPEERANAVIEGMPDGPSIDYSDNHVGPATYDSGNDEVNLHSTYHGLPRFYRESFRGLVLSTAHSKRLNRKRDLAEGEFSKERLTGEMGAAMLVGLTGLSVPPTEVKQRQIDGWIEALEDKPRLVVQAASKAQGACDYIVPAEEEDDES